MAAAAFGQRLQIAGERQSGQDVRTQNVMAVTAVANIVKSSLGPVGLDKVGPGVAFSHDAAALCVSSDMPRFAATSIDACRRYWRCYNYKRWRNHSSTVRGGAPSGKGNSCFPFSVLPVPHNLHAAAAVIAHHTLSHASMPS